MIDQQNAMDGYNQAIVEQRDRLGQELAAKEAAIEAEQQARKDLALKLFGLQSKVMGGTSFDADADIDPEKELARKDAERRRMQLKLKAKKRNEEALEAKRKEAIAEKEAAEE